MWKSSARISTFHNISGGRNVLYSRQSRLCNGKLYAYPGKTCGVRSFANGGVQGSGGSGIGKVALGTTVFATGAVIGGVYYASIDPKFRQSVQDKIPYSSTLLNAILGENEPKQIDIPKKTTLGILHSPSKKSSENNLLPISDKTLPTEPNEEKLLNSEVSDMPTRDVKIVAPAAVGSNPPATISSVDQIGVSAVDLDISKAVEKGISDSKKGGPSPPEDKSEVSKGGGEVSKDADTEIKCHECTGEKEKETDAMKEGTTDIHPKKVNSEIQKDAQSPDLLPETTAEINPVDVALNTAMATVLDLGQNAIELHEQAVTAVQHHRDSVKEALERFEKDRVCKEDWELLSKLSESKKQALDEAERVGAKLTDLIENVQRSITEAKEKGLDASAEVASETLAKLTYALQQVKNRLTESQVEGTVLKQFQEFIKEGKEHLAKELAAIRPEFEIDMLNDKADAALLAYAQKRIRLLEDTLHKREQHEGKLLEEALKKQQNEQEKLSAMELNHELEKLRNELNALMLQKEADEAERHENDLRTQLRRQAAAFSDHLSDVLKVQETELNTKHDGEVRETLLLARQESELKLRGMLARLNGIISAIQNKAETEKHNVEAQELWLACHSLSSAITGLGDERSRPYPIHSEVDTIRRVTNGNEVVGKVIESLSDDVLHRGVYTEESLRRRFPSVKRVCKQVAMVGEDGGGVWSYLVSYIQSLFVVEIRAVTHPVSIDPEELDTYKILSLATYALENGDTEQAVRYMNQLRGEPRRVAKDWIREARLFLEAKQVARFLTSYASAYNIGVEEHK